MLPQKAEYSPPANPADVEAAALELIVRMPAVVMHAPAEAC